MLLVVAAELYFVQQDHTYHMKVHTLLHLIMEGTCCEDLKNTNSKSKTDIFFFLIIILYLTISITGKVLPIVHYYYCYSDTMY